MEDFKHRNNVNSVLDVGCGDGATLKYLGDRFKGLSLHGVDPSRSYIERARSVPEISSATVGSILDGLPEELQIRRYDAVIMASVLHHLVGTTRKDSELNCVTAIRNCLDVLSESGRLYIFEPLRSPRILIFATFYVKRIAIAAFGNRRIELGASWANIGAPLVSFLDEKKLEGIIKRAGGFIDKVDVIDKTHLGGIIENKRLGLVVGRST